MKSLFALILLCGSLAACGSKQRAPAAAHEPVTLSAEQCTEQGGELRGDIGDGKIACATGEREIGRVPLGIEGSICCLPTARAMK